MNHPIDNAIPASLQAHAAALSADRADEASTASAQQKLLRRIAAAPRRERSPLRRFGAVAATACAVLVLGAAVFLGNLAAPDGGLAFASVQRQLGDFDALVMRMVQTSHGGVVQETLVTTLRDGRTRVDVGDQVSVIVDPVAGHATTLLHAARQAMRFEVPKAGLGEADDALQWLEELREFRGEATLLAGTRDIDGQEAHGWALQAGGMDVLLWATAEGIPLEMTLSDGGGLLLEFEFDFDPTIAPGTLDAAVPPGYQPAG